MKSFINELGRGTVSFTNEEFVMIKRFVERRGRDAAHMTVTPVDTVQYCSRRSPSPEISFDTRAYIENKDEDMEKNNEGIMDPEQDQLESPSASTGFETHGPQCHPNWETGRTTTAGCLPTGVGSNLGVNTSFLSECVIGTSTPVASLQTRRKPNDKTSNEANKQFDPGGKGGEPSP